MNDLVRDHVFYSLTRGLEVLTRVKVVGMLDQVFTDVPGHGKTNIGVDVDLGECRSRRACCRRTG